MRAVIFREMMQASPSECSRNASGQQTRGEFKRCVSVEPKRKLIGFELQFHLRGLIDPGWAASIAWAILPARKFHSSIWGSEVQLLPGRSKFLEG